MTITPEEQIWLVSEAITNAYDITTSGKPLLIHPDTLKDKISGIQLEQILDKLVRDHKVIKIVSRPADLSFDESGKCYSINIPDYPQFRKFLNLVHSRHFGAIDRIEGNNFLAICDMAMDILSEIQMADANEEVVEIMIVPPIIRFSVLLPAKSIELLDRYGDYRMKALGYMKERGHIKNYKLDGDMMVGRWSQKVSVWVDRFDFEKFYQQLGIVYERRVVEPAKKQKGKKSDTPEQQVPEMPPLAKIEISSIPKLQIEGLDEFIKMKNGSGLSKFPYKIPAGTKWENIIIQFTNSELVNIQVAGHSHTTGYADMRFMDSRTNRPNSQWAFLLLLAKNSGSLPPSSPAANDKYKKHKQLLADRLKEYFSLDTDPFKPYDKDGYVIKLTLIPPTDSKPEATTDDMSSQVQDLLNDLTEQ